MIFFKLSFHTSTVEFLASLDTQDQAPDDTHAQDGRRASCDFVENPRYCSQVLTRLLTEDDILYPFLQLVSQDSVQDLIYHIRTLPCSVVSRSEFHVRCPRTRFVSQGVVCLSSAGLGIPWTSSVTFFNDSRGPTLFIYAYMSFAKAAQ